MWDIRKTDWKLYFKNLAMIFAVMAMVGGLNAAFVFIMLTYDPLNFAITLAVIYAVLAAVGAAVFTSLK